MSSDPLSAEARDEAQPALGALEGRVPDKRLRRLRRLLPLAALATAAAISFLLFATRPTAVRVEPEPLIPLVRVLEAQPQTLRVQIVAHGTVSPRTESDLVAEVHGRVTWVSPALVAGGFFAEGHELLRLDGREHRISVDRARAAVQLRRSEARLARADAERRGALAERGAASAADLEQFEAKALGASASLDEARALLAQAQLDLERTVLRAPFAGRVRERSVDVGQFVNLGAKLARIYAVDFAEVRLPLESDDLALLELPLGVGDVATGAPVRLTARLAGREQEWPARLVRTEGEIDERTRMLHVVARVDDPYARQGSDHLPLPAGLFVRGEIAGRELEGVYVLPSIALREGDRVYLLDAADKLLIRPVQLVRRERDQVIIAGGLEPADRVVVSPMRFAIEGMQLRAAASGAP
ncbi:MAG: efflux RND transporter periplasmic adaptor subunit [Deltaproteobacteria bacterium]|nr:efflux RND transporter periplasmic adaptor subunit [Deltaproteobacteria bacterium]MBW2361176.1 efflux RND transporter periplasmic adaptor subunit [Deltaproteobacteria bacterium]